MNARTFFKRLFSLKSTQKQILAEIAYNNTGPVEDIRILEGRRLA